MSGQKDFKTFFKGLSEAQREKLAAAADTSVEYIEHFLLKGRRVPRRDLLDRLAAAAQRFGGEFTPAQVMASLIEAAA